MKDLIPITESVINGQSVMTVDARALHGVLEVPTQFSKWFQRRVQEYGFKENVDYKVLVNFDQNPLGGRPATEYALTINMGKKMAMVERTPVGNMVRDYFIECEQRYLQAQRPMSDDEFIARALQKAVKKITVLEAENDRQTRYIALQAEKIEFDAPKVEFYDAVTEADGEIELGELATILKASGNVIGRTRLMEELRELGWLIKQPGPRWNMPTQKAVERGYLVERERLMYDHNKLPIMIGNRQRLDQYSAVTPRGQQYFIKFFADRRRKELVTLPVPRLWPTSSH